MTAARNSPHAIVVLPPGRLGQVRDPALRRWLSRGLLEYSKPTGEMLHKVVETMGHSACADGLAALRFWGQTGDRSSAWIAAADPVHLEARLDRLYLHALHGPQMPMSDLRPIFDFLQLAFGSATHAFARIGHHAYLRGDRELASAPVSAKFVDGQPPDEMMPRRGGKDADTESHHRLVSEVQMALHEHRINIDRENAGKLAANSIWIWGGGTAAEATVEPILTLFSNDPLFKGYWLSRTGIAEPWPKNFESCIQLAKAGFVAVTPEVMADGRPEAPDRYLQELQELLKSKKVKRLTLLFRDGLRIDIKPRDAYRFWRRESPQLMPR